MMIKNLLNADEDPPPGTKVIIEETVVDPAADSPQSESSDADVSAAGSETAQVVESPGAATIFTTPSETVDEKAPPDEDSVSFTNPFAEPLGDEPEIIETEDSDALEAKLEAEIENLQAEKLVLPDSEIETAEPVVAQAETEAVPAAETIGTEKPSEKTIDDMPLSGTLFQSEVKPPSTAETIRQSGLAYSAAIVLFGSVVFTMILGWFADLLLGSSPWGIVGGIILGGIIGFIQFFRITSQIFKK